MINENRELKELGGFKLINLLEGEGDEKIKIFSTLDIIDYCLRNNVKSKIIPAITELDEENNHYLYFNSKGNLSNEISEDDLDRKYAIQTKESKYMNALDRKFKKDSLWVKGRVPEGVSPSVTLNGTIEWINKFDNKDDYLIDEVYHMNDNGYKKVLAERIK